MAIYFIQSSTTQKATNGKNKTNKESQRYKAARRHQSQTARGKEMRMGESTNRHGNFNCKDVTIKLLLP